MKNLSPEASGSTDRNINSLIKYMGSLSHEMATDEEESTDLDDFSSEEAAARAVNEFLAGQDTDEPPDFPHKKRYERADERVVVFIENQ